MIDLFVLSFLGSTFFALTVVAIHLVRRDLPIASSALSKYVPGSYGKLLTAGLYSIGFSQILLSLGLAELSGLTPGNIFLMIAGFGAVIVAIFVIECPKKSFRGHLHDLGAGMQFMFFPFALLHIEPSFAHDNIRVFTEVIGYGTLLFLLLITYLYLSKTTRLVKYFGVIQKTNILLMNSWVIVVSFLFM